MARFFSKKRGKQKGGDKPTPFWSKPKGAVAESLALDTGGSRATPSIVYSNASWKSSIAFCKLG